MYKNFSTLTAFIIAICLTLESQSQEKEIIGIVTTFDSISLIGAQVNIKSTKEVVQTDTLGNFIAFCNNNDKLIVTAKGYYSEKVRIKENTKIAAINLRIKPGEKNRELAIGYGSTTEREKINALARLDPDDVDFSLYTNMYDLIKGRVAGVQVVNKQIRIRGSGSTTSNNEPLIIVDGGPIRNDALNNISPSSVKSISVIKDASAAIYGTRGANGVILIETKRGGKQ